MQTALVITQTNGGWQFRPAPDLPVAALLIGKPVEEAAALLPRLFNLCSGAQAMALRQALGLPAPDPATLRAEILARLPWSCRHALAAELDEPGPAPPFDLGRCRPAGF